MTEQQLIGVLQAFQELLRHEGTGLDGVYYCPHDPVQGMGSYKRTCDCRKPGHALLTRAASDLAIDLDSVLHDRRPLVGC